MFCVKRCEQTGNPHKNLLFQFILFEIKTVQEKNAIQMQHIKFKDDHE
jgi:hypothetical protein